MQVRSPTSESFAPRRWLAVVLGKATAAACKVAGREGAALPGVVALRIDPSLVGDLAKQLGGGTVVVSGTNGKTTVSRILATMLLDAGFETVRNASGSNLLRGLASSLVNSARLTGNLAADSRSVGLFEVDEAALPSVLSTITPRTVVLLDLFRDQLDRYGEVATVARLWSEAVDKLPSSSLVVGNADDPLVVQSMSGTPARTVFFGIGSALRGGASDSPGHASDVKACPRCGKEIRYAVAFLGHLGHYSCSSCDLRTPVSEVHAEHVLLDGMNGSDFVLVVDQEQSPVHFPLPGMYNVYNAIAASAAGRNFGLDASLMATSLAHVTPAFGRMERVEIEGRMVILALAKNPAGLNEVLRSVTQSAPDIHLLAMLNDRIADGRDVSWIWDADVELLSGRVRSAVFGGTRAEDLALRFKYAGVIDRDAELPWHISHDPQDAFRLALSITPPGQKLFIIPTYTALLDIRTMLARLGHVQPYWEG